MRRVVWIEWLDSAVAHGWEEISNVVHDSEEVKECRSVGFVIHESDKSVTISCTVAEFPDQCSGAVTIPKVAITKLCEVVWTGEAS